MFDAAVAEARRPHWYVEGGVPDSLDGRFAMLATVCALVSVRLESIGAGGEAQSAALTERFIEAMDAEHRQLGINDPALGRKVRKMVASLARRIGEWRAATSGRSGWEQTARSSVYGPSDPGAEQLGHASARLAELWQRLCSSPDSEVSEGRF